MHSSPRPTSATITDAPRTEAKDRPPKSTPPKGGRKDKWVLLEERLAERIASCALPQAAAGALFDDPRHHAGAKVTAAFAPGLAEAYVGLAKESKAVERVLTGMLEGSAAAAAVGLTVAFGFTQAQIYGYARADIPNPYLGDIDIPVGESEEVRDHEAHAAKPAYDTPDNVTGADSPDVGRGGGAPDKPPESEVERAQREATETIEGRKRAARVAVD